MFYINVCLNLQASTFYKVIHVDGVKEACRYEHYMESLTREQEGLDI